MTRATRGVLQVVLVALVAWSAPGVEGAELPGGRVWEMYQWIGDQSWTWTLTRRGEELVFDGVARNEQNGFESQHVFQVQLLEQGRIEMFRPDAGLYRGTIAPNGFIVGTADFAGPGNQGFRIATDQAAGSPRERADPVRGPASAEPTPPGPTPRPGTWSGEPLLRVTVSPSELPQTFDAGGKLRVVLPARAVTAPEQLTVARIDQFPAEARQDVEVAGAFDVSLGPVREFAEDVVLEFPFDPATLEPGTPADEQFVVATWVPEARRWRALPATVDAATGLVRARTRTLSVKGFFRRAALFCYDGTFGDLGTSVVQTKNFKLHYDAKLLDLEFLKDWKADSSTKSEDTAEDHRRQAFVLDLAGYLEDALQKYAALDLPTIPPKHHPVKVRIYAEALEAPANYSQVTGRMLVTANPVNRRKEDFQHTVAHELFHVLQGACLDCDPVKMTNKAALWWIEGTAEYASCCVATKLRKLIGGSYTHMYPYLLEKPLTFEGNVVDHHNPRIPDTTALDYDKGSFIDYLVRSGQDFVPLHKAVMADYKKNATPLPGLSAYLMSRGTTLVAAYRGFAGWFHFGQDSPLAQRYSNDEGSQERDAPQQGTPMQSADNYWGKPAVVNTDAGETRTVALEGGYTARSFGLVAGLFRPDGAASLEVKADALSSGCVLDLYVLEGNRRLPGLPAPAASLTREGATHVVDLRKGDHLYVLAVNLDEVTAGSATFTVAPAEEQDWVLEKVEATQFIQVPGEPLEPSAGTFTDTSFRHPALRGGQAEASWQVPRGFRTGVPIRVTVTASGAEVSVRPEGPGADKVTTTPGAVEWVVPPLSMLGEKQYLIRVWAEVIVNERFMDPEFEAPVTGSHTHGDVLYVRRTFIYRPNRGSR